MKTRFGVLGALEVVRDGVPIGVSALKQRIVLATLLLQANQYVSLDQLAERMWDGREAPKDARRAVQTHIGRLRRTLHDGGDEQQLIRTRGEGYALELAMEDLDVAVFLDLLGRAKSAGHAGDEEREADLLQRSLSLWRGPALVDVPSESLYRDHVLVLTEQRVQALERWFGLRLRSGRHDELVVALKAATMAHPLRERLWAQLMVTLYRSGHQAEALQAYHTVASLLRHELGVDPGDELRKVHHGILTGDPSLLITSFPSTVAGVQERPDVVTVRPSPVAAPVSAPPASAPRQLPADIAHFTGRRAELAILTDVLPTPEGLPQRPIVMCGTGGVGKTALAVHWAHLVQNRFPDGQLYLDLHGFGPGAPIEPAAALEMLLRALDVAPGQLQAEPAERSALLRTMLAERRMLLLLDNARDEAQVRPLLPGGQSSVLITSRNQLRGLAAREGAFRVTLDVFSPDESHSLLVALVGEARLRTAPEAEAELRELCSRLPSALSIAAANLDANPHVTLTDYVRELREGNRLAALYTGNDQAAAMHATFDPSYVVLPEPQRRLFRLLGLLPSGDFTSAAAAALAGCPAAEARQGLDGLAAHHLIRAHGPGRYACHDLLRLYAAERARSDENPGELPAASRRLHDWYLHSVFAAARLIHPHWVRLPQPPLTTGARPVTFDSPEAAATWLEAEHANLVALIQHASQHGPSELAWRLTDALRGHFWGSGKPDDWFTCVQATLDAAEAAGGHEAQAAIRLSLADALMRQDRLEEAMQAYTHAFALAEETGWLNCQVSACGGLSNACLRLGYLPEAVKHLDRALELSQQTDSASGQDACLNSLASANHQLGRLPSARDHLGRELSADHSAALICTMAATCRSLGRFDEAARHLRDALSLSQRRGDRGVELEVPGRTGELQQDLGHHAEALELCRVALAMNQDLDNRFLKARILDVVVMLHRDLGRRSDALTRHLQALDATGQGKSRRQEVVGLIGLADTARSLGRDSDAVKYAGRAYAIARARSFRVLEGHALTALAEISITMGAPSDALAPARQALELHRETGHRLGEARALRVIGEALYQVEGRDTAAVCWREALALLFVVGDQEPAHDHGPNGRQRNEAQMRPRSRRLGFKTLY